MSRAYEYYAEAGNVAMAVAAAEYLIFAPASRIHGVDELIVRALTLVPADSHEAGRLLSRYGGIFGTINDDAQALGREQALDRALAIAQREGDIALEIHTLINTARLVRRTYRHRESLDIYLRAIGLARRTNDIHSEVLACFSTALTQSNLGDLVGMRLTAAGGLNAAERLHGRPSLALALWTSQLAAKLEGGWQTARDLGDRGLMVSPRECRLLYTGTLVECEVGDFNQAKEYLEKLLSAMRQTSPGGGNPEYSFASCLIPMAAYITGKSERLEVAEEAARAVLSSNELDGIGELVQFAKTGLALMAVLKGDAEAAREHYASLESQRDLMLMLGGIANDRLLGLLSQTMGELDQAAVHFGGALAFCRRAGYRPELAWSCCDYADMLLDPSRSTGRTGGEDRAKTRSLLDEALAVSSDLGMRPLMERVGALQERTEAQPARAPAYPDGLTQREIEVLRLVCGGKTDREIGEELFISVNTVGNHVRNILNKTNTANRTEAATYAALHGIIADTSAG